MDGNQELRDPLRPWLYLRRNPRRWIPSALVIGLVSSLLVFVITPTNTFHRTGRANLIALEQVTAVTPRLASDFDPTLTWLLDENADQEARIPARVLWIRYPMLIGDTFCPLILLPHGQQDEFLRRLGLRLSRGRLPEPGAPEVAMQADVARARQLELGGEFGTAIDPEDTTPGRFRVVGLLAGEARLAIGDHDHALLPSLVIASTGSFQLVRARPGRRAASDAYLKSLANDDGPLFQVIDHDYALHRTERALRNLPLLVDFLAGATAAVVTLVIALLHLITFHARAEELGVLLVIGRRRAELRRLLAAESAMLAGAAWLVGVALALAGLAAYQRAALAPRGMLMDLLDVRPLLLSLLVPAASTAASVAALGRRLARLDPLAVMQRRGT